MMLGLVGGGVGCVGEGSYKFECRRMSTQAVIAYM